MPLYEDAKFESGCAAQIGANSLHGWLDLIGRIFLSGVHRTDTLSLPLEKRGVEKNSLICTKNCSNYPIYFAIPYKMTTFAKNFLRMKDKG